MRSTNDDEPAGTDQQAKRSPAWALVLLAVVVALVGLGLAQCSSDGASGRGSSNSSMGPVTPAVPAAVLTVAVPAATTQAG